MWAASEGRSAGAPISSELNDGNNSGAVVLHSLSCSCWRPRSIAHPRQLLLKRTAQSLPFQRGGEILRRCYRSMQERCVTMAKAWFERKRKEMTLRSVVDLSRQLGHMRRGRRDEETPSVRRVDAWACVGVWVWACRLLTGHHAPSHVLPCLLYRTCTLGLAQGCQRRRSGSLLIHSRHFSAQSIHDAISTRSMAPRASRPASRRRRPAPIAIAASKDRNNIVSIGFELYPLATCSLQLVQQNARPHCTSTHNGSLQPG